LDKMEENRLKSPMATTVKTMINFLFLITSQ